MSELLKQLSKYLLSINYWNRYVLTLCVFAIWMFFFDKYKISNSVYLSKTITKLEKAKEDYADKIVSAQTIKSELEQHSEKYAREKFFMHKDNEEVFIIEK